MTSEERVDIQDAISELLAWGQEDRYRRQACNIAVAALREKLAIVTARASPEIAQWREHQERLYAMAVDDGETWDLSDNDQAACNAGGDAIQALLATK